MGSGTFEMALTPPLARLIRLGGLPLALSEWLLLSNNAELLARLASLARRDS